MLFALAAPRHFSQIAKNSPPFALSTSKGRFERARSFDKLRTNGDRAITRISFRPGCYGSFYSSNRASHSTHNPFALSPSKGRIGRAWVLRQAQDERGFELFADDACALAGPSRLHQQSANQPNTHTVRPAPVEGPIWKGMGPSTSSGRTGIDMTALATPKPVSRTQPCFGYAEACLSNTAMLWLRRSLSLKHSHAFHMGGVGEHIDGAG